MWERIEILYLHTSYLRLDQTEIMAMTIFPSHFASLLKTFLINCFCIGGHGKGVINVSLLVLLERVAFIVNSYVYLVSALK